MSDYIFLFDLDATITRKEILPELAGKLRKEAEMKELTERTMQGEIPFERSFLERVNILKEVPVSVAREMIREIPQDVAERQVYLYFSNDDRAVFYINGEKITDTGNTCNHDAVRPLGKKAMAALRPGRNILSATCENTGGLAVIDFGLKTQAEKETALEKTAVQTSAVCYGLL